MPTETTDPSDPAGGAEGGDGAAEASSTARRIQERQIAADEAAGSEDGRSGSDAAVQAGARDQPTRFPAQRLQKPGHESELELSPRYDAPDYRGSGKLEGFSAIVTGGDSGIGRSVAVLFAREGADVAIVYLDEHEDAETTKAAIEAEGRRALLLPGDVRDAAWCERAVARTVEAFGRLDVLVNNAAFQMHADSIADLDDERLDLTFRTNIFGYFHMAKAALPHMREGCSIVNTGSVTGLEGSAKLLDYSATKGAIHAFTKSLASNVIERGIRVNCVAPGSTLSEEAPDEETLAYRGTQVGGRAIPRVMLPPDVVGAVRFMLGPESDFVTGQTLVVDGGSHMH